MDLLTLTIVNAFIALVATAVLVLQDSADRQFRYQRYFVLAGLCMLLNASFSALRYAGYPLPYWLFPALTNSLSVGASLALAAGIHRHLQKPGKRLGLLLVFLLIFALHFVDAISSNLGYRMLLNIPIVLIVNLWCIAMLWQARHSELGKVYLAFMATFIFNILQFSARSIYLLLEQTQVVTANYSSLVHSIGFFCLTMFAILVFCCIIMLSHRQQKLMLQQLSERDALTGALNRRTLDLRLAAEFNRCRRKGSSLSLLLLDADHFKKINDTLGHAAGDQAVQHIAHIAEQQLRDYDLLFRFGGEEFLLCLPDTEHHIALQIAERLRQSIEKQRVQHTDQFTLTVSIGVASTPGATDWQSLLTQADQALYIAKSLGRNQVQSFSAVKSTQVATIPS
ncbi:histidine kinase [Alishewanella sp. WH16-1]|uniref:GGDEF domain-containing protein n=1 Tax=Alishewanella sp. WH16-1 TaxID=1651088 RepID=UPI00070EFB44|nr:GGDEF domain-containing protein [Alishewanella sp. WH16-1]KRS21201.1 histidine kinase [Alishewanella sp. WH16-1]